MYIMLYVAIGVIFLTLVPKGLRLFSRNNNLSKEKLKALQDQAYDENAPAWIVDDLKDMEEPTIGQTIDSLIEAFIACGEDLNLFGKIVMRTWYVVYMSAYLLFTLIAWPIFAGMDIGYEIKVIRAISK